MSIEVSDGFNFAMGEWMANMSIMLVGIAAMLLIGGVLYGGACLYEWFYERRMRK